MPQSIDELYIEINAKTIKANDAIDRLVGKLNGLTTSLGKLNTSNLNGLANGVQKLGNAMQVMNTVKTADFTRLARNLSSMGNINTQGLNNTASSLSQITRAMNNIGAVSHNAVQLSEMAKNLSKFGGANVQRATVNIPLLANELRKLMMTLSSAPNVSRNIIDMTNALANLSTQGSKVGSASRSIQRSLNGTHSSTVKASKGFNGLASAIGKFYASYFLVIRGIKGLWSSINTTADYIEAFNYYTVSFGKIASKWDENWENYGSENAQNYSNSFVTTMNDSFKKLSGVSYDPQTGLLSETGLKNLGLNLQEVTQYAAQLGSMMDAVGHSGEVTLATTNAFVKLAGDISSLYNIDYSEASSKIRSVLQGQSRAGYGFGWDTTMASLQATADELNLSKAVSEMSQMEKQQLRILTILNQSRVAYRDQSNTINTLANQLRLLKNNIKEASMVLGQLFVPILSKLIPVINGTTIAIKRLLSNLAGLFGIKIEDTGQGFTDMENDAENLEDTYDDLAESIKVAKAQLLGFDEVNKLQDSTDVGGIDGDSIDLTDEILTATKEYEEIWKEAFDKMEANSNKWADKIEKALSGIGDVFEDFAVGDFFKAGEDTSQLVIDFNRFIAKALREVDWQAIGKNVGSFLRGIKWLDVFLSLEEILLAAWDGLWDAWFASLKESPFETLLLTSIALMKVDAIRNALLSKLSSMSGLEIGKMSPLKIGVYAMVTILGIEIAKDLGAKIGDAISTQVNYEPYFEIRSEHEQNLQNIASKYENLNNQIERYVDLSSKYDTLSDEDKNWVTQMGQDLQDAGIVTGINDITKAWEGTKEELEKVIEKQKNYMRLQANEEYLIELYKKLNELEREQIALHEKRANPKWYDFINPFSDVYSVEDDINEITEEINVIRELIKQAELQSDYFENEMNKDKPTGRISFTGEGAITANISTDEALEKLDELIFGYENVEKKINKNSIKPVINNSRYVNGLNNIQTKFNGMVYDVNNANISPKMNNTSIFDSITNIARKYNKNKNTIELSRINPALTGTSIFNTIASIKNTYDSNKKNIENSEIKPSINSSTAISESNSLASTIKNTFSKFTATVSVESDNSSMSSLKSKIGEMFSKMQIELSTKTVGGKVLATFKKIAGFKTGGFPEDGLFFANHNELVGQFSNGKTAVANNEQITQGIAQAVAPAVYSAVVSAMQNTQRGNSDVVVNIDGKQVFKAVQRQANDYTAQTGLSPFNI